MNVIRYESFSISCFRENLPKTRQPYAFFTSSVEKPGAKEARRSHFPAKWLSSGQLNHAFRAPQHHWKHEIVDFFKCSNSVPETRTKRDLYYWKLFWKFQQLATPLHTSTWRLSIGSIMKSMRSVVYSSEQQSPRPSVPQSHLAGRKLVCPSDSVCVITFIPFDCYGNPFGNPFGIWSIVGWWQWE